MRRKFRTRKKFIIKYKYIIFLIIVVFIISKININLKVNNTILDILLHSTTSSLYKFDIDLLNPSNILSNTIIYSDEVKVNKVNNIIDKKPIVYIYNSHQGETYTNEYMEEYNILPNVLLASKILKEKLEDLNIPTIVEENDILKYMKKNNMKHYQSYVASRYFLSQVIDSNDSIKLYIDLHRDAGKHKTTYININGIDYAKVMFVIGLEYDTYEDNLSIATKLNNIIDKKYPGLSRGIMKKKGIGVNGVYNQDLNPNIILIEVGGNENNIDEVNNTLEILAKVIGEYLNENI